MHKLWTKKETDLLKKLYPITRLKDLAPLFPGRSKGTIAVKALNLKILSAKLWSQKENKILYKCFSKIRVDELLLLLPRRSKVAIWAQGERLGLKQNRNYSRLDVNEHYFKKWSSEMAYILGFILADGCIVKGTYEGYSDSLKFGVQKKDIDILEKIKKELNSGHKISVSGNAAHLSIANQVIVNDLKKLGIGYRKSLKENVPNVPRKYVKDFIRGIIDGDGSIHFDKKNYPTLSVCGGKNTITFIQTYFISKFNIYSKITSVKKYENSQPLFYIGYRSNSAINLIHHLYNNSTIYLERKFLLAKKCSLLEIKHRKKYINYRETILNQ